MHWSLRASRILGAMIFTFVNYNVKIQGIKGSHSFMYVFKWKLIFTFLCLYGEPRHAKSLLSIMGVSGSLSSWSLTAIFCMISMSIMQLIVRYCYYIGFIILNIDTKQSMSIMKLMSIYIKQGIYILNIPLFLKILYFLKQLFTPLCMYKYLFQKF